MRWLLGRLKTFGACHRGNVAMIFAIALVPTAIAVGGGLDYARATMVRSAMNEALDAAALAVGASKNLTDSQAQALAQQYFNANYHQSSDYGTPGAVAVTRTAQTVTVTVTDQMPTTMMQVAGVSTWTVASSSSVVWGQLKLWVALVLDNTGSMSQTDGTGVSKISALKTASHQLLTMLQGAAQTAGDVQVSIIPFARDVNIGTAYSSSSWLSFTDFTAAPPTKPSTSVGPNGACPWTDAVQGYHCTSGSNNGASDTWNNVATSTGNFCPSISTTGHYWNGCYNSVANGTKWKHTWVANATSSWGGCVTDRGTTTQPTGQAYDVQNVTPVTSTAATLMVAENSPGCPNTTILPLGYNWTTLSNKIDAMTPNGSTNQTIGLAWGWQSLTQGAPLSPPALPDNTQRFIILLSDGLNTQNRWSGDGSNQSTDVDGRMALACTNAKADGVIIYAVFVDLNGTQGNSSVLQNCASDSTKYFDLTTSAQIVTAFAAIGQQITNLRVSQ
ncbi:MAG: pilus assembly protein [Rhizomicrobium sp.]|nr:pilus assembly protein [Rhizomicrobium sp.]